MTTLACPHCMKPVAANPIGRWFAPFQCPDCGKPLRFDARTNILGVVGSACFFITAWAALMGGTEDGHAVAVAAGALWVAARAGGSRAARLLDTHAFT